MGAVAWINLPMTRTVDAQLVVVDKHYVPAVITLAQAHIHKLEESSTSRRLAAALLDGDKTEPGYSEYIAKLRTRVAGAGAASREKLAAARQSINEQIADDLDFDDNVALARLDTHVEFLLLRLEIGSERIACGSCSTRRATIGMSGWIWRARKCAP